MKPDLKIALSWPYPSWGQMSSHEDDGKWHLRHQEAVLSVSFLESSDANFSLKNQELADEWLSLGDKY